MKKETENKQQSFSFKKGHTLPMSDENLNFLENCQKALLIGNLRGMIVDNNDDGKPSFFQTTNICDKKAKMALTFYKRFSDVNKFTHFLVHEDDLQYYKDFIENFALETGQVFTHRLRGKSTEYKIAFIPPIVDLNAKSSINIGDEYRKDLETLSSFAVGSEEQDKQIKYMLQKYVAICLNYTDGKLNEVYTDHGNITVIVYKDNKMFTNVYYKVNKLTGEKIEIRDFDNVPKMFNDRINRFKGKKTMTYDFILMNPPYDKNLHLKIVEQSIPMLTDDGILVNLSPIRWLQDPLAKYKKTSDWYKFKEVRGHTHKIDVVSARDFQAMFNAIGNFDLGTYVVRKSVSPTHVSVINPVIERVSEFNHSNPAPLEFDKYEGYRVRIPIITAGKSGGQGVRDPKVTNSLGKLYVFKDGYKDGKQWWEHYQANQFTKKTVTMGCSIGFENETQGTNFCNTFDTIFGKFYNAFALTDVHVNEYNVLWLGNCINPRTGLKGYKGEWTDDDFRAYFGITDSEWEEIIETMKPYM